MKIKKILAAVCVMSIGISCMSQAAAIDLFGNVQTETKSLSYCNNAYKIGDSVQSEQFSPNNQYKNYTCSLSDEMRKKYEEDNTLESRIEFMKALSKPQAETPISEYGDETDFQNATSLSDIKNKDSFLYQNCPTTGDIKALVFLVDFADMRNEDSKLNAKELERRLEGTSDAFQYDTPHSSVSGYYRTSSYGKLNIDFDVYGWYNSENNRSFYENAQNPVDTSGNTVLIEEIMEYYDDSIAFADCTSLKMIEIPDSVRRIEFSAFSGCTSLKAAEIPKSVTWISSTIFENCTSLTSVIIPGSVEAIGYGMFDNCHNDLIVYGLPGSYAETYAKENNINFNAVKSDSLKDQASGIEICTGVSAPSDTVLNVEKISENTESVTYNITLTDNGKDVDLKGEKAIVRIPVSVSEAFDYKVYRKEAEGKYTDMEAIVSNEFLVFFTDHFSEYTVSIKDLIPDTILGDVSADGKINDQDSILLSRYLSEWGNEIDIDAADMNEDGKVNDQDSIVLARTLAGWYE